MSESSNLAGDYLTFSVANEVFALPLLRVDEIREYEPPTRVPCVPPVFRGIINLRGRVLPLVDLALKLGLPVAEPTRRTCIVRVEVAWGDGPVGVGLIVDEVIDIATLDASSIEPPPDFATVVRLDYLCGIGKAGSRVLLLLDMDRALSRDEMTAAAAIPSETAQEGQAP